VKSAAFLTGIPNEILTGILDEFRWHLIFPPNYSRILNNLSSADKKIKLDGHEILIEKAAGCGYLMRKSSYVNVDKIW